MSTARTLTFTLGTALLLVGTACGPATPEPANPDKKGADATACNDGKGCGEGESCVAGKCQAPAAPEAAPAAAPAVTFGAEGGTLCATSGGKVMCWGDNRYEILKKDKAPVSTPVVIAGIEKASAVALGQRFGCAVDGGGKLWCFTEGKARELPLVSDVADISVRDDKVFIVKKSGDLAGVSLGWSGKEMSPTEVPEVKGIAAVESGNYHSCALHKSGEVTCWGDVEYLGNGVDTSNMDYEKRAELGKQPALVKGLKDAVQISVSDTHSCALRKDKKVVCWGTNWSGELGDGSQEPRYEPVAVQLLDDAVEVRAGYHHSCARRSTGKVICWGGGGAGQLGSGTPGSRGMVEVQGVADATQLVASREVTCAARAGGAISCWGAAARGRLGNGTTSEYVTPQPVAGISGVKQLALGDRYSCALDAKNQLQCWGKWGFGGEDAAIKRAFTPRVITGVPDIESITARRSTLCAIDKSKDAFCEYLDKFEKGGLKALPIGKVKAVQSIGQLGAAIAPSGQVILFGKSWSSGDEIKKMNLAGMTDAIAVGMDSSVLCAVKKSGKVSCLSYSYKVFDAKDAIKPTATIEVPGVKDAIDISAESGEMCILRKTGEVGCLSTFRVPPVVDPKNPPPAAAKKDKPQPIEVKAVKGIEGAVKLVAGGGGRCAVVKDGSLLCWGGNSEGQLGVGDLEYRWEATAVPGLKDVKEMQLGQGQGCAVKGAGDVLCWGINTSDEAGQPAAPFAWAPVPVTMPK